MNLKNVDILEIGVHSCIFASFYVIFEETLNKNNLPFHFSFKVFYYYNKISLSMDLISLHIQIFNTVCLRLQCKLLNYT